MQGAPGDNREQDRLWRGVLQATWPLLAAQVGLAVLCLVVGLLIWRDIDHYHRQEQRQALLAAHVLQAQRVDQRLAAQQRHLYQLSRIIDRRLQGEPAAASLRVSDPRDMLVFERGRAAEEQATPLIAQLHSLAPLMNDLYYSDTLIERLFVSLPQGPIAAVPAPQSSEAIDEPLRRHYRLDGETSLLETTPQWYVLPPGPSGQARIGLSYDILDEQGVHLARVGLELDNAQLSDTLQRLLGPRGRSWLVDAAGQPLLGTARAPLPEGAGRRGLIELPDENAQLLLWAVLPTTGWQLVKRHPSVIEMKTGIALLWVVLLWALASMLLLLALLALLRRCTRRRTRELAIIEHRVAEITQRIEQQTPAWLMPPQKTERDADEEMLHETPFERLNRQLASLDAALAITARRPLPETLIATLEMPIFLTCRGRLVATNTAFERLLGQPSAELRDLQETQLLPPDETNPAQVRFKAHTGEWWMMRRYAGEDGKGHALVVLIDESPFRRDLHKLSLSLEHAKRDARLRSRHLALLRREIEEFSARLLDVGESDAGLHERGTMLKKLLEDLDDSATGRQLAAVQPRRAAAAEREPRLLIVDDGPVNTRLAQSVLARHGFQVETAASGDEALSLAAEHFFDLVFMDIFMPAPDGIETSRRWREREAVQGTYRSVLVALTANASEHERERFFAAGMDDYLAKPYRPQALIEVIRRWLPLADTTP